MYQPRWWQEEIQLEQIKQDPKNAGKPEGCW
jgi:hypothetical protein